AVQLQRGLETELRHAARVYRAGIYDAAAVHDQFRRAAEAEAVGRVGSGGGVGKLEDMGEVGVQQPFGAVAVQRQPGAAPDKGKLLVEAGGFGGLHAADGGGEEIGLFRHEQVERAASGRGGDAARHAGGSGAFHEQDFARAGGVVQP